MTRVLHAEWTKLRTTTGPAWLLGAVVLLTAAIGPAAAAATRCPAGLTCAVDPVKLSLTGVQAGQAVVAVLGVLVVSAEYSTRMIQVTLAAVPRRGAVLGAKAACVAGLALLAGALGVAASILAGRLILPGHGFAAARGFPVFSLSDGLVLRSAAGSVLYLGLIALLSAGIAALARDSAVAIGVTLGLVYLFPVVTALISNATWQRRLERYTPMAGLNIQATTGLRSLPISPWAGLGVLAAWAAAALLAGGLMLRLRDA
ncbi:MAG: ABC transporter permease [Streptosporangiaceae bacterium]